MVVDSFFSPLLHTCVYSSPSDTHMTATYMWLRRSRTYQVELHHGDDTESAPLPFASSGCSPRLSLLPTSAKKDPSKSPLVFCFLSVLFLPTQSTPRTIAPLDKSTYNPAPVISEMPHQVSWTTPLAMMASEWTKPSPVSLHSSFP